MGIALRESLLENPIVGWDAAIANELAYEKGVRQVKHNLALMFDKAAAHAGSDDYELRRPAELLQLAKNREYVLDIHDLPLDSRAEFVAIGEKSDPRLLGIAALLGIRNVLIFRGDRTIVVNNPHALVIEFGRGEHNELVERNVSRLRKCMGRVAVGDIPAVNLDEFDYYERVFEIPTTRAEALKLSEVAHIEPFGELPLEVLQRLRRDGSLLPLGNYVADYWNGQSSAPGKWFGSVILRICNPFKDTQVPKRSRRMSVTRY